MASGEITIRRFDTAEERDAETGWDEGDLAYVVGVGLTNYGGSSWSIGANAPAALPEVPASPDAQDVVDALVTLGLVTQAGA